MTAEAGWHPVALAADLDPGTSAGTRLHGRELVVWRDAAGLSHVWEDRCPHRGMRLSFGFVRGSHIACLYHGWQFDAAGRCRYIPAHPALDVPASITVERYASAERLGIVWVFSNGAVASTAPPGGNSATTAVRSLFVAAPESVVRDALAAAPSPFEDARPASLDWNGPLATLRAGADSLHVALQALAPDAVALHIALGGPADAAALKRLSRWAEALRRAAEGAETTA